jgi:molybdate transport system substrate-binding protein
MDRVKIALAGSLVLLAFLIYLLHEPGKTQAKSAELTLFVAASNRAVIENVREDYEKEFGVRLVIQYGPSQALLSAAEVSQTGDLYLPADDSYLRLGKEKGLINEVIPLASTRVGLVVPQNNPLGFNSLADVLRDGVRLVQGDPDVAAIGNLTRKVLQQSDNWKAIHEATMVYRPTVTDVANDVKLDTADVGIVFDAVLSTYPELDFVPVAELSSARAETAVGVLRSSTNPTAALHFARYLSASDRGLVRYAEQGFMPVEADLWDDDPELDIFAAAMLRSAIEPTIQAFAVREGIRINTNYNGCGILVGQMESGTLPDAFFAGEAEFLTKVEPQFGKPLELSENQLVILVEKGNPHDIVSLRDLAKPGLRVGIGHEKQGAMGWLTQRALDEDQLTSLVMPNVVVQTATGDMLVNQMNTGALDAAVAYVSNVTRSANKLDVVRIQDLEGAIATQSFAIGKRTKHRQLLLRLQQRIFSSGSRERFVNQGFRWKMEPEK